ncbi:MAG: hypothetical protein Q9227_003709 [Pyrenula ochraceoflavens]
MADDELDQIRKARLAQLQHSQSQSHQFSPNGSSAAVGAGGAQQSQEEEEQRKQAESEARSHLLRQILQPPAQDRLNRIRLVRDSRATDVENRLIMLARSGQLRGKVDEEMLKGFLGQLSEFERSGGGGGGENGGIGRMGEVRSVVKGGGRRWDEEEDEEEVLDRLMREGGG